MGQAPRRAHGPGAARVAVAALALALVGGWAAPAAAQRSEADVDVAQAVLAYEDRRYDEALAFLRQALALDPDSVDALYYTGLTLMAQGKSREAVPPLERARRLAPDDVAIAYQLGLAHFTLREYDRAEPLLASVLRREPRTDGIGYYVGFLRYQRRDYQGALDALGTGGASDPRIQQLTRMYRGLSLAALGRATEAAAEVEAAVRIPGGAPLTGPADRFREGLRTGQDRSRRWRVEARVGILYDTNAPVLPEPSHDFTAEQARRDRDRHTLGELFALNVEYAWLRSGPWEGTLGYAFLQIVENDLPEFSVQSHKGTVGITYSGRVGGLPYQLGTSYAYDYLTLDDREFLQRHTITATAALVESTMLLSALQARIQVKEFSRDSHIAPGEVRDAVNWMLGLVHVVRFSGDRHFLRLGYQVDEDVADGRNFDYVGHRLLAGGQYTLPWGGTRLRYDYDVHFRNYRHRHTVLPEVAPGTRERADVEQTHVARVEQPLPLRLTLAFEYQGIVARSNLPLFSYNRNIFSLILSWQY